MKEAVKDLKCDPKEAREFAKWIFKHFELAPAGTLKDFKAAIAKMAKHG